MLADYESERSYRLSRPDLLSSQRFAKGGHRSDLGGGPGALQRNRGATIEGRRNRCAGERISNIPADGGIHPLRRSGPLYDLDPRPSRQGEKTT
jgi:hypothetical protein